MAYTKDKIDVVVLKCAAAMKASSSARACIPGYGMFDQVQAQKDFIRRHLSMPYQG